tara:strand:+ start:498 stop:971 length:474 start_codon:yes stop_codon:yes gene_type:complete
MHNKRIYDITIAIDRLRNYCATQDRCQWDVMEKMRQWGLLETSQNHILEMLIQEKYVDEERYARSFCRGKFKIKKWGRKKLRNELKKKNISEACITRGLEEIKDSEYRQELNKQYHKKKNAIKEKNHFLKTKKIVMYLMNKGYESNLIWENLRESKE